MLLQKMWKDGDVSNALVICRVEGIFGDQCGTF